MTRSSLFEDEEYDNLFDFLAAKKTNPKLPKDEKHQMVISYAVIEEKEFRYLAILDEDGLITLRKLHIPDEPAGFVEGTIVNQWKITWCKAIVYFQGRKKLAAFSGTLIYLIDLRTGTMDPEPIDLGHVVNAFNVCILGDCPQNVQKHNAVPYSQSPSIIIMTALSEQTQILSFNWKEKLEVKLTSLGYSARSATYCGGMLWTAHTGVVTYKIEPDTLAFQEIQSIRTDRIFCDLALCNEGVIAVTSGGLVLVISPKGELKKSMIVPWSNHQVVPWMGIIAFVPSSVCSNLFADYSNDSPDEHLYLMNSSGNGFRSKMLSSKHAFVWRNTLIIISKTAPQKLQYRKVDMSWSSKRLLWIGNMKNNPNECLLASVPREIIREIVSYSRGELSIDSYETFNFPQAPNPTISVDVQTTFPLPTPRSVISKLFEDEEDWLPQQPEVPSSKPKGYSTFDDLFGTVPQSAQVPPVSKKPVVSRMFLD